MSDRGLAVLLVSAVLAAGLGLVLFIGAAGGARGDRPGEGEPRVFFGDRPPPAARTIGQVQERVPGAVRGLVPVQRQVASASREAAGYLLTLLFVGSALVFARGPVIAAYRATGGGWRAQLRVLALGGALLAVITSAIVLLFISMLGAVAAPTPGALAARGFALGVGPLLQIGVTAIGVAVVLVGLVVVVGFAAVSWRLGDAIVALRPLTRLGQGTPATLIALLGASLLFVLGQVPLVGNVIGLAVLAYALGAVATARLAPQPAPGGIA
jgi:hypothetical protein